MKTYCLIIFIIYSIGCFITHFIICYKSARKNNRTGKYKTEIGESEVVGIVFWPIVFAYFFIISPFLLTEKLAIRMKENTERDKINAEKLVML